LLFQYFSVNLYIILLNVYRPPIGLIPKKFHDEIIRVERFNEVCGAISRYYNHGLKINIEWVEEYNELIEKIKK